MKNKCNKIAISGTLILGSLLFAIIFMISCKKTHNDDFAIAQIQQEFNEARAADNSLLLYTDSLIMCRNNQNMPNDSSYYIMNMYRCDNLYHLYDSNMRNHFYNLQNGAGGMMGNNMGMNFTINGMQCYTAFEWLNNTHAGNHPL